MFLLLLKIFSIHFKQGADKIKRIPFLEANPLDFDKEIYDYFSLYFLENSEDFLNILLILS